ncbi:MAG: BrnT family toxin [Nitrospinota bacterium]
MEIFDLLLKCTGFEWDMYNADKIRQKHGVTPSECEEVFFNQPLVVAEDVGHSQEENRFYALGHTDSDRGLFVVFTIRGSLIRVISARNMNRKEKKVYRSHEQENTDV